MVATKQPRRTYVQLANTILCHADAMQIFSFVLSVAFSLLFTAIYGAPEEIRTPDPQIRSSGAPHDGTGNRTDILTHHKPA
jgi:hypothetical protein